MTKPTHKAAQTAKWATTMTKWLVSRTKSRTNWQLVEFSGPGGFESRGIVDLLAIRKDHRTSGDDLKRGGADWPALPLLILFSDKAHSFYE